MSDSADDATFEDFWRAYPRRVGKGAARRIWAKLKPSPALAYKMVQALAWQRTQEQWTRDGGAYIPYPSTWLYQERWDDEPVDVMSVVDTSIADTAARLAESTARMVAEVERRKDARAKAKQASVGMR